MVRFEDPPAPRRGVPRADHKAAAEELRGLPGMWGFVTAYQAQSAAAQAASNIRNGDAQAYQPKGAFDATSRTVNGEYRLYVKFIGEETSGDAG
ncbi:hypothetical protein ACIP79_00610 [Streptomyces sp. NPDC088747]|uniref:hypothetical protein n=1 Tax=Streptomyces sp. NPDC088747 TaxID=3365886 RepID=UPI0037FB0679